MHIRIACAGIDSTLEVLDCCMESARLLIGEAQSAMCHGVVRVQAQYMLELLDRGVMLGRMEEGIAKDYADDWRGLVSYSGELPADIISIIASGG